MEKQEFDRVKLGMSVGFVFGPGEFPEHNQGVVTAKVEDRWGLHLEAADGKALPSTIEGFTTKGVGVYLLDKEAVRE